MTLEELLAKQNDLRTEAAAERRAIDEGIAAARVLNANVRTRQAKVRALDEQDAALTVQIRAVQIETLKADAEAKAQAKAQEQSELERVRHENDELKAALAAKG